MEKTFNLFYAFASGRLCQLNENYRAGGATSPLVSSVVFSEYEAGFAIQYQNVHRLETNKIRNTACLYAHLLANDHISW